MIGANYLARALRVPCAPVAYPPEPRVDEGESINSR